MSEIRFFDWVDSSVLSGIDEPFVTTFAKTAKDSSLQIKRLRGPEELDGDRDIKPHLWTKDVSSPEELENYSVWGTLNARSGRCVNLL
jgi:hypothetical protein